MKAKLFYLAKKKHGIFFKSYIHCFPNKSSIYKADIFFSAVRCFQFTWTEGSNRNDTTRDGGICNTGDEIPCYPPLLETPAPPTNEEIYNSHQDKACDKGANSYCIKVM